MTSAAFQTFEIRVIRIFEPMALCFFDNQLKFIPKVGFDNFFDIHDLIGTEKLGWGVSDQELFNKWLKEINNLKEPFSSALTILNHHPFSVPDRFKNLNLMIKGLDSKYHALK